jgi:glycerophosphoryl diester phosphodiesterase
MIFWVVAFLVLVNAIAAIVFRDPRGQPVQILAHRVDAPGIPENSLAGVKFAINNSSRAIEIDIRRTRDGTIVLSHDRSLKRLADVDRFIDDLTWDEIQQIPLYGESEDPFRISKLEDIINLCGEKDIQMVIEFKDPALYPGIGDGVRELLGQKSDLATFISFDRNWIYHQTRKNPGEAIKFGTLHFSSLPRPTDINQRDVHVFWWSLILDPASVRAIHRKDKRVVAWTVNNVLLAKYLRWLGVDAITSDNYQGLSEALN